MHSAADMVNRVAEPLTDSHPQLLGPIPSAISTAPRSILLPIQRDRHKIAFTLENVLTSTECSNLISSAEQVCSHLCAH